MPNSDRKCGESAHTLTSLREEIDAVDDALHDLVMRRARLTRHMGTLKSQSGGAQNPIRPAREAAILRRLAARHGGEPPFGAIVQIWRELIAANLRRQCEFGLAVVETGNGALREAARSAFGALTPITSFFRPQEIISALTENPGLIGVLPAPARAVPELLVWPELLAGPGAPRILLGLPALDRNGWPDAYAIGHGVAEPSGDDISFLLLTGKIPPNADELAGADFDGSIESVWPAMTAPGRWCGFACVRGFISPTNPALARLDDRRRQEGGSAVLIGAAPAPVRPPDG